MTTKISPLALTESEFHSFRKSGIGGSDVAAICGISPFRRPLDVWMDKMGLSAPKDSPAIHWGKRLERIVADEFGLINECEICPGVRLQNGICIGDTDAMIPSRRSVLEVKTASAYSASEWGPSETDEIPDYYITQVQWYLGLLPPDEYVAADVAVLIGGRDFRQYRIERNAELFDVLRQRAEEFWKKFVVTKTPPPSDGSIEDIRARLKFHPADDGQMLTASPEIDALADELADAKAYLKKAEEKAAALEDRLKLIIGDASGINGNGWKCSWKKTKDGQAVDWKKACALAGVSEDIITQCTSEKKGTRRFLFKSTTTKTEE